MLTEIKELARDYCEQVRARRTLGDSKAEYHSREPKIRAYKLLMDQGRAPRDAVDTFADICARLEGGSAP